MATSADAPSALDDLLTAGTPDAIRATYHGLADEARSRDFGLLEEDVIVLDTETTGLSFSSCELIEVAAVRLSGREVQERFHALVHPDKAIPSEIQALTGITNADVASAPSADAVIRDLADFVGGAPVLAHNATFDRTFVEKVPGGRDVSDMWVDTLALSRIALPALSSHRLADMARAFGCDSVSHRAMDDVDALSGMWRIILCGLSHLPAGLLGVLADMHPEVEWAYRPILSHLALESAGTPFSLAQARKDLLKGLDARPRQDAGEAARPLVAPTRSEVAEAFSADGVVSRMYDGFERRPEQVAMAEEVRDALDTSTHRAIEAGTGVGKSIAYLLPLVLYAQRNDVTVGVATKTNALSDQLVSHELPALARALPHGLTFYNLKGYDHYVCLRRLERSTLADLPAPQQGGRVGKASASSDMLTALAVSYAFACQSPDGDLDALGIRWRSVPRPLLTVGPNECTHVRCPFFPDACMLHGARRRSACADVVVTNHSLLLRNVDADGKILPPIRHWVVDEAHSFEQEARRQWAVEVTADVAKAAFEEIGGLKTGAIHTLMVQSTESDASTLLMGLLTKASAAASRASLSSADLMDAVHGLLALARQGGGYDTVSLWIGDEVRRSPEWAAVAQAGQALVERLDEAVKALDEACAQVDESLPKPGSDLTDATRALRDLMEATRLITEGTDDSYVFSAQLCRTRSTHSPDKLVAEKLDIGGELAERWLPDMSSVTFTSATMAVGDDFAHFDHMVGLDRLDASTHHDVRLDSSYDFDDHMCVVVTKDLPDPYDRAYIPSLADLLFDVHVSMDGSVLTLFTNRREMEATYELLQPRLAEEGLDLMCQERSQSPRHLRERFLSERSASLFALKSFWEGFDAAGETLRCVVIPKLPFSSPNDPLSLARENLDERAWWHYSLPEAVMSVKQAAGRLIRTSTDTGLLVLADSRLMRKTYGRLFVSSMPSSAVARVDCAQVGEFIDGWRQTHE